MVRPVARVYVPERGDAVWISLDPQAGHEQAGRRPALVLSPSSYNRKAELALVCPITNQAKGYPFEVVVPEGLTVTGVIMAATSRSSCETTAQPQFQLRYRRSRSEVRFRFVG